MEMLAIDCETSGLIHNRTLVDWQLPEIVEVTLVRFDLATGAVVDEFDALVKPAREFDETTKAAQVHGITNAMVVDAPRFAGVFPRVRAMIEAAPVVVGHNVSFDREAIDVEAARLKVTPIAWPRCLDTIEQTMHLVGRRMSLAELHRHLTGVAHAGAHRSRGDVDALIRCCVELHKKDML